MRRSPVRILSRMYGNRLNHFQGDRRLARQLMVARMLTAGRDVWEIDPTSGASALVARADWLRFDDSFVLEQTRGAREPLFDAYALPSRFGEDGRWLRRPSPDFPGMDELTPRS